MSAGIRLFQMPIPMLGQLQVRHEFSGTFPFSMSVDAGLDFWWLTFDDATRLAAAAGVVLLRFKWAVKRDEMVKVGSVFARKSEADEPIIDLGIYDDESIYFQFFNSAQVRLPGEQCSELLEAFLRLGEHAAMVRRAAGAGNSFGLAAAGPSSADDMLAGAHASLDRRFGW